MIVMKIVEASGYEKRESVLNSAFPLSRFIDEWWDEQSASNIMKYKDRSAISFDLTLIIINISQCLHFEEHLIIFLIIYIFFFSSYKYKILLPPTRANST